MRKQGCCTRTRMLLCFRYPAGGTDFGFKDVLSQPKWSYPNDARDNFSSLRLTAADLIFVDVDYVSLRFDTDFCNFYGSDESTSTSAGL